ncbi:MAG: hypothetical protein M5R36_03095 [Deltaproteobacteria bacterium]|nr:hypothetical protein [Deltaproteobacteria bacterium]
MLGKALVDSGAIGAGVLKDYLLREVHARLQDLLEWEAGLYVFKPDTSFLETIKRPPFGALNEIYEAARGGRLDDRLVDRYETHPMAVVEKSESRLRLFGEVTWASEDLLVTALVDGTRNIEQIAAETHAEPAQAYRVLGLLEHAGAVRLV